MGEFLEKNILITGKPRTGKSTLISKLIKLLESKGKKIGGLSTPEIKEKSRLGFKIIDIGLKKEGILAHLNLKSGPRVSKYRVNMNDLEKIGVNAIKYAIANCDFIIIDEIGKMELFSKDFCDEILYAMDTKKVLGTIGFKLSHPLANQIKSREDVELIELTIENRDNILKYLENKFA
jgi:nucleoside-triphosphatase THEP1